MWRPSIRSVGLGHGRATTGRTSWWRRDKRWAARWRSAARTWASWPAARSSSAGCRAGWPARRSTAAAGAAACSPCKPANSTSAARRPRATSALTRDCYCPAGRGRTSAPWGRRGARVASLVPAKVALCLARLARGGSASAAFDRPVFKEFVVRATEAAIDGGTRLRAVAEGILAGVPLGPGIRAGGLLPGRRDGEADEERDRLSCGRIG